MESLYCSLLLSRPGRDAVVDVLDDLLMRLPTINPASSSSLCSICASLSLCIHFESSGSRTPFCVFAYVECLRFSVPPVLDVDRLLVGLYRSSRLSGSLA